MTHLHQPQSWTGRAVKYCRKCKRKRRVVVSFYEYYEPYWKCCGCGGGTATSMYPKQRAPEARQQWPTLPHWRAAVKAMMEAIEK